MITPRYCQQCGGPDISKPGGCLAYSYQKDGKHLRGYFHLTCFKAFIEKLFGDDVKDAIVLATYHRSKGREWGRVILFEHSQRCPSRAAKQDWQKAQEENLAYVAITRAQRELLYLG